jgi:putative phosphoribosyl transferase
VDAYRDRQSAGAALAGHLAHLADGSTIVLGIPRGGVEVAAPVAEALAVPLGVVHAIKVGAPGNPEFAIGAVAPDGVALLDEIMARRLGMTAAQVERAVDIALAELRRREDVFGVTPEVSGRTVVVVDDGVATGATLRAALGFVRRRAAETVVCAVPVGSRSTIDSLPLVADEVVCPVVPETFRSVGEWYGDFSQTTDERVLALLGS